MGASEHKSGVGVGARRSLLTRRPGERPFPLAAEVWRQVTTDLRFSPQQVRLVELLLRGHKDKAIAQEMGVAVPTVRTYLTRLFLQMNVADRVELILHVLAVGREIDSGRHRSR